MPKGVGSRVGGKDGLCVGCLVGKKLRQLYLNNNKKYIELYTVNLLNIWHANYL